MPPGPIRHNAVAAASDAPEPLHEGSDRCLRPYAQMGEGLVVQDTLVAANEAHGSATLLKGGDSTPRGAFFKVSAPSAAEIAPLVRFS
jgi:hypothetical protein